MTADCDNYHQTLRASPERVRATCRYVGFQFDADPEFSLHLWNCPACSSTISGPEPKGER